MSDLLKDLIDGVDEFENIVKLGIYGAVHFDDKVEVLNKLAHVYNQGLNNVPVIGITRIQLDSLIYNLFAIGNDYKNNEGIVAFLSQFGESSDDVLAEIHIQLLRIRDIHNGLELFLSSVGLEKSLTP